MPDETPNGGVVFPDLPLEIHSEAKIFDPGHPRRPPYFDRAGDTDLDDLKKEDQIKLEKTIREALEVKLPHELKESFGVIVTVEYQGKRTGSFIAIFLVTWHALEAALPVFDFISKYKDFYESVELIRAQARRVLESALRLAGFPYDVAVEIPNRKFLKVRNDGFARPARARPLLGRAVSRPGLFLTMAVLIIILELGVIGSLLYNPAGRSTPSPAKSRSMSHAQT